MRRFLCIVVPQDQAILELKEDIKNTPRPVLARRQPESLDLLCPEDASKVDGKVAQIECLHAVLLEQRRLVEVERHYFAIFAGLATATLAAVAALIFLNRKLKQASLETRLVTLQDEKKPEIAEAQEDEESEEAEALEDEESEVSESQEDEESEVSESQEDEESEVSESQEDEESEEAEALEDEESEPKEDEESEVSESQEDEESEEAEGKEDEESEAPNREDEERRSPNWPIPCLISGPTRPPLASPVPRVIRTPSDLQTTKCTGSLKVSHDRERKNERAAARSAHEPKLAHSVSDQRTNSASSRESRATCLQEEAAPSTTKGQPGKRLTWASKDWPSLEISHGRERKNERAAARSAHEPKLAHSVSDQQPRSSVFTLAGAEAPGLASPVIRTPSDLQTTKCTGSLKVSHDRERKNERAAARSAHEPKLAHSVSDQRTNSASSRESRATCLQAAPSTTKCTGSLKVSHDRERKNERAAARSAHEPKLAHSVSDQRTNSASSRESRATCLQAAPS
ncbi:hypothetical protein C7M84_005373, partial [Penaeus vannamei]